MNDMNASAIHPNDADPNSADANDADIMRVDDTVLTVRPITIGDVERLARLFTRLSPASVHFRFFSPISRPPRAALLRLADVDHCRRDALVALDGDEIVAVARYDGRPGGGLEASRQAEIAITVEDAWQHRGVGRRLARRLATLARDRGYDTFVATMLPDNRAALGLVRKLVPDATVRWSGGEYEAAIPLMRAS
jgi:GNAT superfamily N-acetyltransferase